MSADDSPRSVNIDRALSLIRRRGPIVLACILIAAGSAYAFARQKTKQYTATASLLFSPSQVGLAATGLNTSSQQPPSQSQQDTNVQLVGLGQAAAKTAEELGPHWSAGAVRGAIGISANSDTSIVSVAATAPSPVLAQKIANTYAATFVIEQQQQELAQITAAQRLVNSEFNALSPAQRGGPQGVALADRAQTLGILAKLATGNVTLAGRAGRPSSPSSPRVQRDVLLGGILGLLIGITLAFVLERFDRRIREPEELGEIYQAPVLAGVPERKEYSGVVKRLATSREAGKRFSRYDEVFSLLRSYVRYAAVDRDVRTLLVISADPGDGKTTISFNLAKAAAALGSSVLLIEGDLRRGTVIDVVPDGPRAALPDVLTGSASIEQTVCSFEVGPTGVLDVLVAGEFPPPNPGELMESQAMESLLVRARTRYDLVIIDTPPLGVVADAIPLLTRVDGVIVVGRMHKSSRPTAERLSAKLMSMRAPVLGVVANRVRGDASDYAGRYQDYGSREPVPALSNGHSSDSTPVATITGADDVR